MTADDDDGEDELPLPIAQVEGTMPRNLKKRTADDLEDDDEEDMEEDRDYSVSTWSPKRIVAPYTNPDGIKCITIIISLTSGCVGTTNDGLEISLADNGNTLVVAEQHSEWLLDTTNFYNAFNDDPDENVEEVMRRRFAVKDRVRQMIADGETVPVFTMPIPFRADKSSMRVELCANDEGAQCVHIDLSEKSKVKKQRFTIMSSKKSKVPTTPTHTWKVCS
jgi:hypothetical protein